MPANRLTANDADAHAKYPARPPFFAHKFVRLLVKTCAAQDIGTTGFTLLATIAHTEDAAHYRRPVTWTNEQLSPVLGMSRAQLIRVRERCIELGWLYYQPGAKGRAGRYWVLVPEHATGLDDLPTDEGDETYSVSSLDGMRAQCETECGRNPGAIRAQCETHSSLSLTPDPGPEERAPSEGTEREMQEVVNEWNSIDGVCHVRGSLEGKRLKALKARLGNPAWRRDWRDGMARVSTSAFLKGGGANGWRADMEWFLKPDSLTKILEGKYDDGQHQRNGHRQQSRAEAREAANADAFAVVEAAARAQHAAAAGSGEHNRIGGPGAQTTLRNEEYG